MLAISLAVFTSGQALVADAGEVTVLRFVSSRHIAVESAEFTEPSGLAYISNREELWSVSDDTGAVFRLSESGDLFERFDIAGQPNNLEGVAWDAAGERLLLVRERPAAVVEISGGDFSGAKVHLLSEMNGYRAVAELFEGANGNHGLEGIDVVLPSGNVLLIKENHPRLMLEVSGDLTEIRGLLPLSSDLGFARAGVPDRELDVSGLAFDPGRKLIWITSDTGKAVFAFSSERRMAVAFDLMWRDDGKIKPVHNPEGIAISADGSRILIVSDDGGKSRIFEFATE